MATRSLVPAGALVLATTLTSPLTGLVPAPASAARWSDCGEVAFTPGTTVGGSHYGVQQVRADRVACAVARRVAARAEAEQGEPRYAVRGFTCTRKAARADGRRPYACVKRTKKGVVARIRFLAVGTG